MLIVHFQLFIVLFSFFRALKVLFTGGMEHQNNQDKTCIKMVAAVVLGGFHIANIANDLD